MQKLVLGIAVAMFFGSASSADSPQGYCEKGLYIGTHIIECVAFCADHGTVYTLESTGAPGYLRICKCVDGIVKEILPEIPRLQCHE